MRAVKKIISIYDKNTGAILSVSPVKATNLSIYDTADTGYVLGRYEADKVYINPQTKQPVALEEFVSILVENNRVSNIPDNTTVHCKGKKTVPDNGVFEIETTHDCTVRVLLQNPIYKDTIIHVPCLSSFSASTNAKVNFNHKYDRVRSDNYPDIGDQLDMIWKYIEQQPGNLPWEVEQMLNNIRQVKGRFPK